MTPKADANDYLGRFREIVSDPLNLLIDRTPMAGLVEGGLVHLHNGNRVPLSGSASYYGEFSNILVINRGVHEPLEEFVFQELLKRLPEAPFMLELGAYWGHYSMWLKRQRPQASVCMVEPESKNLNAGRKNFALNGFEGEFVQAFVGEGHFQVDPFMAERGLQHIDVLHSDIQGYEVQMLEGAAETLGGHKADYVFVSTHSQKLHRKSVARLETYGYRVEISSDFDIETTSADGFIFASRPEVEPVFAGVALLGREQICESRGPDLVDYIARLRQVRG